MPTIEDITQSEKMQLLRLKREKTKRVKSNRLKALRNKNQTQKEGSKVNRRQQAHLARFIQ